MENTGKHQTEVMTAGLRMNFPCIEKKKIQQIVLGKKVSFLKKQHICLTPSHQIKVFCCKNIFYIKHISDGKSCFQVKTKIVFLVGLKAFYFYSLLLNWWKWFVKLQNYFDKRFFPIKAFDKYTLCISSYYKCTDEWIHLAITDF